MISSIFEGVKLLFKIGSLLSNTKKKYDYRSKMRDLDEELQKRDDELTDKMLEEEIG